MSFLPQLPTYSSNEESRTLGESRSEKNLASIKKARKQIEADAHVLANRIALLKQEELKALKKIEETKKKAQEVLLIKRANEERELAKQMKVAAVENKVKDTQIESAELRKQKKIDRQNMLDAIYSQKHQDMMLIKQQRELNSNKKADFRNKWTQQNRERSQAIKEQRSIKAMKLQEMKETKLNMFKLERAKVLAGEENKKRQKEIEVLNMEKLEMELIQKLQKTQLIQKTVTQDLESALSQTPKGFTPKIVNRHGSRTAFTENLDSFKTL